MGGGHAGRDGCIPKASDRVEPGLIINPSLT